MATPSSALSELRKLFTTLSRDEHIGIVYRAFAESSALALANTVPNERFDEREERYEALRTRHGDATMHAFAKALGTVWQLAHETGGDILGQLMMEFELGGSWGSQFFSPNDVARLLSSMLISKDDVEVFRSRGQLYTINDPCVGAGGLLLNVIDRFKESGYDCRADVLFTGTDKDALCVHLSFIQLCIRGAIAEITLGDTLTGSVKEQWQTPNYYYAHYSPLPRSA